MANQRGGLRATLQIVFLAAYLMVGGCRMATPTRPGNVPSDSVYVVGAYVGWWERCSYEPQEDVNHCQIFNAGGEVLSDEVFLPYDGGRAAKQSEMKIVSNSDITGPQYVCLSNGRILIPKSHFENQKRTIDSLIRSRSRRAVQVPEGAK